MRLVGAASGAAVPHSSLLAGQVIAHLGNGLAIETTDAKIWLCHANRRMEKPVVGDHVRMEPAADGEHGRIVELLPRRSVLLRPAGFGKSRPFAANLDVLLVVVAAEPPCDLVLVDQYLAVCETFGIEAHFVVNKCDLPTTDAFLILLQPYQAADYPLHVVSAATGTGVAALRQFLVERTSLFTGQSGVGKSSLSNALLPSTQQRIGDLSRTGFGQHTTTTARLYHLPSGGDIIDTPGMNVFGLDGLDASSLADGFREFRRLKPRCQFSDCRHLQDKGCAVRQAVEHHELDAGRYQRYLKLRDKLPKSEY